MVCKHACKAPDFSLNPTCVNLRKESMFKNVPNPLLQLSVLLDLTIILVEEAEYSVHKPLRKCGERTVKYFPPWNKHTFMHTLVETILSAVLILNPLAEDINKCSFLGILAWCIYTFKGTVWHFWEMYFFAFLPRLTTMRKIDITHSSVHCSNCEATAERLSLAWRLCAGGISWLGLVQS